MEVKTDTVLWDKLRSGDRDAFRRIYESEFEFLYQYGVRIIYNTQLVEDAIQELFIELWNSRERLSPTDSIRKYIAVSLKRKMIKMQSKQRKTELKDDFTHHHNAAAEETIEDKIIAGEVTAEQQESLKQAISELAPRQREVMYLRVNSGLDNEGIAEVLDISNQSVRNLISGAIKKLAERMTLIIILLTMSTISLLSAYGM